MNVLRKLGVFLRWLAGMAVTLVVIALLVRTAAEWAPKFAGWAPMQAAMARVDPYLAQAAEAVKIPWSHGVRGMGLPVLAIALILLRGVIGDAFDRVLQGARPKRAAPPPALPPGPAQQQPVGTDKTVLNTPPPAQSATGTMFLGSQGAGAPAAKPRKIGRYEVELELGHGAMGVVYKARDPRIGRTVAIKTISAAGTGVDLEQYRARFLVEAKSAGRLNHPGIVSVHDVTDDEAGRPCIVLEFVEGEPLDHIIARQPFTLDQVLDIVGQVARALDYAHANGIVHRDVKPANIMLTASGQAKLGDFGIAKLDGTTMTIAGQILGTPAFMSPEQCAGDPIDARSDIFSLGTVLYVLATGSKPFPGDTFTTVAYKVAHSAQRPAHEQNAALPSDLDRILERCLAKAPADRYQTAGALAADIEALRASLPKAA
jgi:hypothetical protein